MDLIDDLLSARWRLRRITAMQTAAFDLQIQRSEEDIQRRFTSIDDATRNYLALAALATMSETSTALLLRYETTYGRMYDRALKALERLQKNRPEPQELEESIISTELRNDVQPSVPSIQIEPETIATTPIQVKESPEIRQ